MGRTPTTRGAGAYPFLLSAGEQPRCPRTARPLRAPAAIALDAAALPPASVVRGDAAYGVIREIPTTSCRAGSSAEPGLTEVPMLRRIAMTVLLASGVASPWSVAHAQEARNPNHAVYLQYCSACHGPEGKGDGPLAA